MPINYFQKLTSLDFWKKPRLFWLSILILFGLAAIVFFIMSSASKVSLPEQIEISKKPPAELPEGKLGKVTPLASGKQTYSIMAGNSQNPQIIEVDVNPLDVKQGKTQIVTVQVKDAEQKPITQENKVEAIVFTDSISTPFPLSLKEASGQNSITVWEGSWVCQDTHDLRYMMTVKAKNASGEHSIDLSFR